MLAGGETIAMSQHSPRTKGNYVEHRGTFQWIEGNSVAPVDGWGLSVTQRCPVKGRELRGAQLEEGN